MTTDGALLELTGITKSYGAVRALAGVDFEAGRAEVVALVGDNGAGKSTLVKVVSGTERPDDGTFAFDGRQVTVERPQDAAALGIATVYQDLALCDNLDVVANLFLGREETAPVAGGLLRRVDETAMERRAVELLERLSVRLPDVRTPVAGLSGGQRQSVAVARSLTLDPRIVLLDEPTAALGVAQTRQVLDLIGELRGEGLGVVVVSHNLDDVFAVSDRIVVLRLGRRVASFDTRDASRRDVVAAITGADVPTRRDGEAL